MMQKLSAPRSPPRTSVTSNYSTPYSPTDDDDHSSQAYGFLRRDVPEPQLRQQVYSATPPPKILMEEYLQPARVVRKFSSPDFTSMNSFNILEADPMAAHLLVETARAESQGFKILSPDELDRLKKEEARLARLIEAGKKKLYIESRVDNAAKLLQKLGSNPSSSQPSPKSPISPKKGAFLRLRTSIGSTASTDGGSARSQNDAESTKLQELAKEVWKLEKKQDELRARKLEHTAGVLQASYQRDMLNQSKTVDTRNRPFSFAPMDDMDYGLGITSSAFLLDGHADGFGFENQVRSRLREINLKMRGLWTEFDSPNVTDHPQPPGDMAGPSEQLNYLEDCLFSITESHSNLVRLVQEARRRHPEKEAQTEQVLNMLADLWDTVKSSKIAAQDMQRNAPWPADAELHDHLIQGLNGGESFTLDQFSDKVNAICTRASTLELQQMALQNQITHEREARRQSNLSKDAEKSQLAGQLRAAYDQNLVAQDNIQTLQGQLADTNTLLIEVQEEQDMNSEKLQSKHAEELSAERNARKTREHHLTTRLAAKESEVGLLRSAITNHEAKLKALETSEAAARTELQDLATQFDIVGTDLLAAENRLAAYHASTKDTNEQFHQLVAEKELLQEQVELMKNELARLTSELAAAKHQASKHQSIAQQAADQAAQLAEVKADADTQVVQLRADIVTLRQRLQETETIAAKHLQASEQSSELMTNLRQDRNGLQDELEHLRQQVITHSTALQEAEDRARATEMTLREKTQDFSRLESEMVVVNANVKQRETALRNLRSEFEGLLTEKTSELNDLDSRHRNITDSLKKSDAARLESESALQTKSKQLDELGSLHVEMTQRMEYFASQAKNGIQEHGSLTAQLDEAVREQKETQARLKVLQKETGDMVTDYEYLVKMEIDGEKERIVLENTVDALRDRTETLEKQLMEEKLHSIGKMEGRQTNGELSNGMNGDPSPQAATRQRSEGISIVVMRNEFRKMMKDAKSEHHQALRAEQEERRRLESIIRSLQRDRVGRRSIALSGISQDNASLMSASDVFSA